jgi:hypothetical protein
LPVVLFVHGGESKAYAGMCVTHAASLSHHI